MKPAMPFYFLVLDGQTPCDWAPYGTALRELAQGAKRTATYEYNSDIKIELSIVCRDPQDINDETFQRVIGLFIDAQYLDRMKFPDFRRRFVDCANRLQKGAKLLEKHVFRIHYIIGDEVVRPDNDNMRQLTQDLALRRVSKVCHDFVRKQTRFGDVLEVAAFELALNSDLQAVLEGQKQ
jgi:hypothetical protein